MYSETGIFLQFPFRRLGRKKCISIPCHASPRRRSNTHRSTITAARIGLFIAFVGTLTADYFAMPALDGAATIGIGVVLGLTALTLARERKGLLIGEPINRGMRDSLVSVARSMRGIVQAGNRAYFAFGARAGDRRAKP
jgi:hypothetical protein